jgi:adenylate kinase
MRLVVFGPQGAGKGTQSALISEKFGIPSIATGDIFREQVSRGTPLGLKVKEYLDGGHLVPDDLTIEVVHERLSEEDCVNGWLLDGFPRSVAQAEALETMLATDGIPLDAAIVIDIPEEVSLQRIMSRRICSNCGRNYSLDNPPQKNWTCDVCGGEVVARSDDTDEPAIRRRLELYYEMTEPLKAFYEQRSLLRTVDGQGSPAEVFDRIVAVL